MKEIKQSETIVINRTQINFAPYNPKKHSKDAINQQKQNFKRVGFLGGVVWNEVTGNLVSGHKRVMAMDEYYGYDGTAGTDYQVKVERVEMDEKTEKEQNIFMDATNTNTQQDYDLLALILPDIDYKNAGLTEQDIHLIGVDYSLQTEFEKGVSDVFSEMKETVKPKKELTEQEKIDHVKAIKEEVKKQTSDKVENMDSYFMVTFDTLQAKREFLRRFDFPDNEKYIKGEVFGEMIERV